MSPQARATKAKINKWDYIKLESFCTVNKTKRQPTEWEKICANFGEGNGNPLQCSCLENPRGGGAWWAAVYGVAQSWTRLKQLSSSSNSMYPIRGGYPKYMKNLYNSIFLKKLPIIKLAEV